MLKPILLLVAMMAAVTTLVSNAKHYGRKIAHTSARGIPFDQDLFTVCPTCKAECGVTDHGKYYCGNCRIHIHYNGPTNPPKQRPRLQDMGRDDWESWDDYDAMRPKN